MPPSESLRNSKEFRLVYSTGAKYEDALMAVFVRPNGLGYHRLGITASRKYSLRAVDRNRAKRLLREAFRLNESNLAGVGLFCDWVINPRRSLMNKKVHAPVNSFRDIIFRVRRDRIGSSS